MKNLLFLFLLFLSINSFSQPLPQLLGGKSTPVQIRGSLIIDSVVTSTELNVLAIGSNGIVSKKPVISSQWIAGSALTYPNGNVHIGNYGSPSKAFELSNIYDESLTGAVTQRFTGIAQSNFNGSTVGTIGVIDFLNTAGTPYIAGRIIGARGDNALGSGQFLFQTTQGIGYSPVTRLIIDKLGYIGIGPNTPIAPLDIQSVNNGILIPRLTTTQRDAISSPSNSLLIFNTTTDNMQYYSAIDGVWKGLVNDRTLADATQTFIINNGVSLIGDDIFYFATSKTASAKKLFIQGTNGIDITPTITSDLNRYDFSFHNYSGVLFDTLASGLIVLKNRLKHEFVSNSDNHTLVLAGGSANNKGSAIELFGKNYNTNFAGSIYTSIGRASLGRSAMFFRSHDDSQPDTSSTQWIYHGLIANDGRWYIHTERGSLSGSNSNNANIVDAPSVILDIDDTARGVRFPRMTTTQVNNITSPANSLLVYNTTLHAFVYNDSGTWRTILNNKNAVVVASYAAMIAYGVPSIKTDFKVTSDETLGGATTRYEVWPDGDIINIVSQKVN